MMNTRMDKAFDITMYAMTFVILTVIVMLGLAISIAANMVLGAITFVVMEVFVAYFVIDEIKKVLKKKES